MRVRDLGSAALVGALCLGVAGCGEDSPKPSPVTDSPAADNQDPEAFTRDFIKTLNTGSTELDTSAWRAMFTSDCVYCERVADQLDSIKKNGGSFKAKPWRIRSVEQLGTSAEHPTTQVTATIPPQRVRYAKGGKLEEFGGQSNAQRRLNLRRSGSTWVVTAFGEASK